MLTTIGFLLIRIALANAEGLAYPAKIIQAPGIVSGYALTDLDLTEKSGKITTACKKVLCCNVTGTAPIRITWKKGFPGRQTEINTSGSNNKYYVLNNGQQLFVKDLRPNTRRPEDRGDTYVTDEDYYQCFASNEHGSDMSTLGRINVNYIRSPVKADLKEQDPKTSRVGMAFTLDCLPNYISSPPQVYSYLWFQVTQKTSTVAITENDRISIIPNGTIIFAYTIPEDYKSSEYRLTCSQRNSERGLAQESFSYEIKKENTTEGSQPLRLAYATPSVYKPLRGTDFKIRCIFVGRPVPRVEWTLPVQVTPDKRDTQQNQNTLALKNAEKVHSGIYTCVGSLGQNTPMEHNITVEVQFPPEFDQFKRPMDKNATVGLDVKFDCKAVEHAPAVDPIEWYINAKPAVNSGKIQVSANQLEVKNVTQSDVMVIQCVMKNAVGYNVASGYLVVLLPFMWKNTTHPGGTITIETGQDIVELKCETNSDPNELIETTWYHNIPDGGAISNQYALKNHPGYSFEKDNSILMIDLRKVPPGIKVKDAYEGDYLCVAYALYNDYEPNPRQLTAEFTVKFKPGHGEEMGVVQGALNLWWVALIAGGIVVIIIVIIVIFMIHRNRKVAYRIGDKEVKAGLEPEVDLANSGFQHFTRVDDDQAPVKSVSKEFLNVPEVRVGPPVAGPESDEDSLKDYGDVTVGKFNEDGSFIGEYGD